MDSKREKNFRRSIQKSQESTNRSYRKRRGGVGEEENTKNF